MSLTYYWYCNLFEWFCLPAEQPGRPQWTSLW